MFKLCQNPSNVSQVRAKKSDAGADRSHTKNDISPQPSVGEGGDNYNIAFCIYYNPRHKKTNNVALCDEKTQISLSISSI